MKNRIWIVLSVTLLLSACSNNEGTKGRATDAPASPTSAQQPTGSKTDTDPVKLTFATYFLSDQMKTAVKKYESLHPNVEVELRTTLPYGKDLDEVTALQEKYITTMNTEILAGKGPDLMELDILPQESYTGKKLLLDLDELIESTPSFNKENYFMNILDNAKLDGGLYGIPLYFSLDALQGDAAAIGKTGVAIDDSNWSWEDFIATAKQLKQKGNADAVFYSSQSYMLSELTTENFAQMVKLQKGKKSFDAALFISYMNQIKQMNEEGILFDIIKDGGGRESFSKGDLHTYFYDTRIESFENYVYNASIEGVPTLYTKPHPHENGPGGYFTTLGTVGINANSAHQQAAWDLLQFLMEDEAASASSSTVIRGFPINQKAYDLQAQKLAQAGKLTTEGKEEITVSKDRLNSLKSALSGAVHWNYAPSNLDLEQMIYKESEFFFSGQKSAESVAKLVQNKVNLMLNE
ncbi:ABC transporter substrate-binding protein [Paenibacillus glycanilyticus]|uniref:ABC transporter substrate-binding protein n=1 Tax=Paenibacillus glycanilyticus TaxID=126569 RepID=UPI0013E3C265|nr:ABC transporter substrate-binding protein [Paenibacillus glycanilyticus]